MLSQSPLRQGRADRVWGKGTSRWANNKGCFFEAAAGQWNIGRNDDVTAPALIDDPVVSDIWASLNDYPLNAVFFRYKQEAVGDNIDLQAIAARNLVGLILHRAGIGINKEARP
jgi:hypothetical protein